MLTIEPGLLGLDQPPRHRLRHEIGRAHVEREHEVEVLELDVDERGRAVGAGVVDQDVERRLRGDGDLRRLDVAHVERERVRALPARADRCGGVLDFVGRCAPRASRARRRRPARRRRQARCRGRRRSPARACRRGGTRGSRVRSMRRHGFTPRAIAICSLPRLRGRVGGGGELALEFAACPLPVPPRACGGGDAAARARRAPPVERPMHAHSAAWA